MAYTPYGPWTNGSSPGISAAFLNALETFLALVNSAATDGSISAASGVLSAVNALLSGGLIGKSTAGDIIDASTTTTILKAQTAINLAINGVTIGSITSGGADFTGQPVTTSKLRLQNGSFTRVKIFTGTGSGTYTHGLGSTPDFVCLVANNTTASFGYNSPNSTTVGVNVSSAANFVAFAIALN